MLGAIAIARMSTDLEQQQNLLDAARQHLLEML
jgi:hypothetical protein